MQQPAAIHRHRKHGSSYPTMHWAIWELSTFLFIDAKNDIMYFFPKNKETLPSCYIQAKQKYSTFTLRGNIIVIFRKKRKSRYSINEVLDETLSNLKDLQSPHTVHRFFSISQNGIWLTSAFPEAIIKSKRNVQFK